MISSFILSMLSTSLKSFDILPVHCFIIFAYEPHCCRVICKLNELVLLMPLFAVMFLNNNQMSTQP